MVVRGDWARARDFTEGTGSFTERSVRTDLLCMYIYQARKKGTLNTHFGTGEAAAETWWRG